jgi:hypothetical protein
LLFCNYWVPIRFKLNFHGWVGGWVGLGWVAGLSETKANSFKLCVYIIIYAFQMCIELCLESWVFWSLNTGRPKLSTIYSLIFQYIFCSFTKIPQNCKGQYMLIWERVFMGAGLAPTHQFSAGIHTNMSHRLALWCVVSRMSIWKNPEPN